MLVYYFGHIDGTLEAVANAITAAQVEISVWARLAYRKGEDLRTKIDPLPFLPAKEVELDLGDPVGRSGSVIIPLRWKATGVGALFPVMIADLVLQPIGPDLVEIIFRGSYDPPLGGLGRILDRAVLHRLAEGSAKAFLDQLCEAIEDSIASDGKGIEDSIASDGKQDPDGGAPAEATVDRGVAASFLGSTSETG